MGGVEFLKQKQALEWTFCALKEYGVHQLIINAYKYLRDDLHGVEGVFSA